MKSGEYLWKETCIVRVDDGGRDRDVDAQMETAGGAPCRLGFAMWEVGNYIVQDWKNYCNPRDYLNIGGGMDFKQLRAESNELGLYLGWLACELHARVRDAYALQ